MQVYALGPTGRLCEWFGRVGRGYLGMDVSAIAIRVMDQRLTKEVRPKLPPVDPRYFVGDTQTRLAMAQVRNGKITAISDGE